MFRYFGDSYPWDLAVLLMLNNGVAISDLDRELQALREIPDKSSDEAVERWSAALGRLAEMLVARAGIDRERGFDWTAGREMLHAGRLFESAAAALPHDDPNKDVLAARAVQCGAEGIGLRGDRFERVEIDYGDAVLPALFRPADTAGPAPCVVAFNGLDTTKEWTYSEFAAGWGRRGLAVLALDSPGSGEALRVHGLTFDINAESVAGAALDYLSTRADVDVSRVGVHGISMGSYSAVRAACMEPRIAACAALGAFYSMIEVGEMRLRAMESGDGYAESSPRMLEHIQHVFGIPDMSDLESVIERFAGMDLGPVIQKLACPLLVVHGLDDAQVPTDHGRRTAEDAINCRDRTLLEFTDETGGSQHCSVDNFARTVEIIEDWFARVLHAA